MQGDLPDGRPDLQDAPADDGVSSSEDLEMRRQEEWARAEEMRVVYVHRQTTTRFAIPPHVGSYTRWSQRAS